jgi:hypothetical protein
MPKRTLQEILATLPEWEPSDDDEPTEPTEQDKTLKELDAVEAELHELERRLATLHDKRRALNAKLDAIPGARYVPTSPSYDP